MTMTDDATIKAIRALAKARGWDAVTEYACSPDAEYWDEAPDEIRAIEARVLPSVVRRVLRYAKYATTFRAIFFVRPVDSLVWAKLIAP